MGVYRILYWISGIFIYSMDISHIRHERPIYGNLMFSQFRAFYACPGQPCSGQPVKALHSIWCLPVVRLLLVTECLSFCVPFLTMRQLIPSDMPKYGVACYADITPAHQCSCSTAYTMQLC